MVATWIGFLCITSAADSFFVLAAGPHLSKKQSLKLGYNILLSLKNFERNCSLPVDGNEVSHLGFRLGKLSEERMLMMT